MIVLITTSFAVQAGSIAGDSYTEEQTDVDDATTAPSPGDAHRKCFEAWRPLSAHARQHLDRGDD